MTQKCPCSSGKSFEKCCEPIIQSQSAQTAEQLMRSRYSAYATGNAEYIFETTHPLYRESLDLSDIKDWSKANTWKSLEILNTEQGNLSDLTGIVEFKAFFTNSKGSNQVHHERSEFEQLNNQWYYTTYIPVTEPTNQNPVVSRNAPCPCGSGKKHKRCCG